MLLVVFLLLFSYYLLFDFQRQADEISNMNWTEILVTLIVSKVLIEDFCFYLK
jgi:hypothetical protein